VSEQQLASVVVESLRADGWKVYQEVSMGYAEPTHDIVAVRPGIFWLIECKTSLSLDVIGQAAAVWYATLRSVAVPKIKRRPFEKPPFAYRVCGAFGVGVLRVGHERYGASVSQVVQPRFNRIGSVGARQWEGRLSDDRANFCAAGTKGGGYWTPWKETMQQVERYVATNPGCTIKDVVNTYGPMHYASTNGFANGIRVALKRGWVERIRLDDDATPWRLYPAAAPPDAQRAQQVSLLTERET
jgi:hypothetical protein